ncbi:MAG TPA: hypothetical protein DCS60_06820 [Opitutae bacterium]|nr:hypothetical protein [Opitutae bacterium]
MLGEIDKHPDNHSPYKRTTFADIAKRAGVCKATVSLKLHNNSRIPEKTRKHIKEIAHEMVYHFHPLIAANMAQFSRSRDWKWSSPNIGFLNTFYDEKRTDKRVK